MSSNTPQKLVVRLVLAVCAVVAFAVLMVVIHPTAELAMVLFTALIAFYTFELTRPIDQSPPDPPAPPI